MAAGPLMLTYADIADLSRWHETVTWGCRIPRVAPVPIELSYAQASEMDGEAIRIIDRHNEWTLAHRKVNR